MLKAVRGTVELGCPTEKTGGRSKNTEKTGGGDRGYDDQNGTGIGFAGCAIALSGRWTDAHGAGCTTVVA